MNKNWELFSISSTSSILKALKQMDISSRKLLLVFAEDRFIGVLSIGDIQRAIINNADLKTKVSDIMRTNFRFAKESQTEEQIKDLMVQYRIEFMPIVDEAGNLVKVIFWEDIIKGTKSYCIEPFNLPVIIMAGGKGTRLKPLTNVLPKPLFPIGEKTILEEIMDRFVRCGSSKFYLSVNYKADIIKYYFRYLNNSSYQISYFQETKPLGTAGSLYLLKNDIQDTFFVTNCDIIINEDYSQILKFHKDSQNELTAVAALKNYPIPYGIFETGKDGLLQAVVEKPDLMFKINTGMYILEPHLIDEIPQNEFFHITSLMGKLRNEGRKVGIFPINEKSWIDIGDWEEYQKVIKK